MAKRTAKKIDYRQLKAVLNKYYTFSFKSPRTGKDFSPQQKSAIRRKWNKIAYLISDDSVSWLSYPKESKLPGVDGVRTDKGIFYKYPGAKLVYSKRDKKYHVVVAPKIKKGAILVQKRRDIFYPFPPSVIGIPHLMLAYVEALREKYKPDAIRWSTLNRRESQQYDPKQFDFYFSLFVHHPRTEKLTNEKRLSDRQVRQLDFYEEGEYVWRKRKFEAKLDDDDKFYNGVFLIYYLNK